MSRFVLPARKRKPSKKPQGEVVRISANAYNCLIEIAKDTTLPIGHIASRAIEYAYENLELEQGEE